MRTDTDTHTHTHTTFTPGAMRVCERERVRVSVLLFAHLRYPLETLCLHRLVHHAVIYPAVREAREVHYGLFSDGKRYGHRYCKPGRDIDPSFR